MDKRKQLKNPCRDLKKRNRSLSVVIKNDNKLCKICGDKAPGNYRGVLACDGCKSFFIRSVRGGHVYKCRFERNCIISKYGRTQCRHCRLKKCLDAGLNKDKERKGIQKNRDPINSRLQGPKPQTQQNEEFQNILNMNTLISADELIRGPTNLSLGTKLLTGEATMTGRKVSTLTEYLSAMKDQLLLMVTWAKSIPAFCELVQEDKIALLRAYPGTYTILGLARRSLHLNDFLIMGNGYLLTRDEGGVMGVTGRIIDELVLPFRKLKMDDTEFALLKGILIFDPSARGLREPNRILKLRQQSQSLLEEYIRHRHRHLVLDSTGRFGDILLRLLSLHSIAHAMHEEMQYRELFGVAPIDKLIRQMLLGEDVSSEVQVVEESSSVSK